MATLPLNRARPAGGPGEVRIFPEAASQSFKEGEFVNLVSGKVTVLTSGAGSIPCLGMAMHDASGTTDTDVEVLLANPNQKFRMSCGESSAAAIAVTDVGTKYAFRIANNRTYVDPSDGTNEVCVIRKVLFDAINAGDLNPEVIVTILPAVFQGGAGGT